MIERLAEIEGRKEEFLKYEWDGPNLVEIETVELLQPDYDWLVAQLRATQKVVEAGREYHEATYRSLEDDWFRRLREAESELKTARDVGNDRLSRFAQKTIGDCKDQLAWFKRIRNALNDVALEADDACPVCGQQDVGQTGEHPCAECGLPIVWDDAALEADDSIDKEA